jgi:hypothetical protein
MSDELKRLQEFIHRHKARSCSMDIGNGYGATCWSLELTTEKGTIRVAETGFISGTLKPDCYVVVDGDADDFEWPGLERVINLALEKASEKVKA